jgi:hypothetical protein
LGKVGVAPKQTVRSGVDPEALSVLERSYQVNDRNQHRLKLPQRESWILCHRALLAKGIWGRLNLASGKEISTEEKPCPVPVLRGTANLHRF